MAIPWDLILGAVFIFAMRICDVSLGTMRLIFLTRGQKYHAAALGFVEVTIFLIAISEVIRGVGTNWLYIFAYSAGFAAGNIIGVMLEERIAMGYSLVRIFTHKHGFEMAEALRNADFGATEIFGQGRDGTVYIVETVVRRKDLPFVQKLARDMDAKAFLVIDEARSLFQGYLSRK